MSPRDWRFRILDILTAAEKIEFYMKDLSWEAFLADSRTQDAVIRQLTVIGEAAVHIPEEIMGLAPGIRWSSLRGLRNIVVHEYFGINIKILWNTTVKNIPELKRDVQILLRTTDEDPQDA